MRDCGGSPVPARTGLVAAAALAAVGAGVCYCVYRATSGRRGNEGGGGGGAGTGGKKRGDARRGHGAPVSAGGEEHQAAAPGSPLLQKVSAMPVIPIPGRKGSGNLAREDVDLPNSSHDLEAHHIQNLIRLLDSTKDPTIQEQVLITLGNSAAFSVNQDIIRNLGGLIIVGKMLSVPDTKVKEKALNALNNLSMNIKNQEELKKYITIVCEETDSSPLNSELQLAGLRFLTNMSVTNDYHYMMTSFISHFLHMLLEGNERTQVQVLKVLVNLSANPAMAEHLLNAQAPFFLSLFDACVDKEVLLRVLVFATNLTKLAHKDKNITAHHHSKGSIFSELWGNTTECAQKLTSLLCHHDPEVKEQAAELIMQRC